jgi:hypothetical protein
MQASAPSDLVEAAMGQEERKPAIKRHRRPSLSEEDVAQIKAHLNEGKKLAILAKYFGVHESTISRIRHMKSWRHVAPAAKATALSELVKARGV